MGLLSLIREHGDAIEADLAFRGFDLLDMWRGKLSPRKVDVLIRGLPVDSATRQAVSDHELWSRTDFLLADLIDVTNRVAWCVANKDVPKKDQGPFPDPYPRPGMEAAKKKPVSAADLLAFRERTKKG